MKKNIFIIVLISAVTISAQWQISAKRLKTDFVLSAQQAAFDSQIKSEISALAQRTNYVKVKKRVEAALYKAALYFIKTPELEKIIVNILRGNPEQNKSLAIRTIITAKTLYPNKFEEEIESLFNNTRDAELAVYSLYYLRENNFPDSLLLGKLKSKFPESKNLLVKLAMENLSEKFIPLTSGELSELFGKSFLKNKLVIFTFLRHDRSVPGITFIRKPNGEFLSDSDSTLSAIPQLGYSVTNLPYFLEDGNTPQGLFSFQGFYQSKKKTIGPTPALITRLPFEITPEKFSFIKLHDKLWSLDAYKKLLSQKTREDKRFAQTFFAGKLGRSKLVVHGSTDNPKYYNHESYYPLTPTTGCLSSVELWDDTTGKNVRSDQLKLVNMILRSGRRKGFLLVAEIDDKHSPITKNEISNLIRKFSN